MTKQVELVLDAKAELGEGPLWDEREKRLYWVDIVGHALHIYDPASRESKTGPPGSHSDFVPDLPLLMDNLKRPSLM